LLETYIKERIKIKEVKVAIFSFWAVQKHL
jgi:hypothetical protein